MARSVPATLLYALLSALLLRAHALDRTPHRPPFLLNQRLSSRQQHRPNVPCGGIPSFTEQTCTNLPTLICNLKGTAGNNVAGTVYFSPAWAQRSADSTAFACYTRISAAVQGLSGPSHGFHVHTYGDLSGSDGKSTGGHFTDPQGSDMPHGYPNDQQRHWGDLGNLNVGDNAIAEYDRIDDVIRLGAIVGRSITIHAEDDKGVDAQPSGGAGARVAYCVIGYANPDVLNDV